MCSIYFLLLAILLPCCFEILSLSCSTVMKDTLRYLAGIAGPSGYGSKTTAQQVADNSSSPLHRLTAIITGATSGIGAETARVLAKRGVRVVIPARDIKKAAELKEGIENENPNVEIMLFEIDLSSLASVKRFCTQFLALGLPLNILINNAGIFSQNLEFSEDKIEMTFATNYLGHYLMTEMLIEKMVETAEETGIQGRIINLSSVIHSWVKRDCFSFTQMLNPKNYNATRAYAQSKLANILHAKEVARQLKARNAKVTINAVHPGIVKTGIIRAHKGFITGNSFFFFYIPYFLLLQSCSSLPLRSDSNTKTIGASTSCYVALSPQAQGLSGKYFADCNECNCSALANDELEAQRLWRQTRALIHRRLQYQFPTPS
ncbi:short-chain dehydrogenase TIC 32, chloroplastic-like [Gossypium australe]|uniref:Short-chain dehydrogenase TIC 32, chloroplastic-like n=1 Tax=Gossypium australe TaxID=47621 RepID=A0A5B6UKG1_9ROSI|nr:short-chain dehydrogenase TIC 32, chloroplastic-like [Gossypium australe]